MPPAEGVIQFDLDHTDCAIDDPDVEELFAQLIAWRRILRATGLIGQDPERYEGYAWGNLSLRVGSLSADRGRRAFLVTGSQTSGRSEISPADCALVEDWDTTANRVTSRGRTHPSSESLSHAAVFDAAPHIQAVVHAHSPELWRATQALELPITDAASANGTPAMARAIERCWREGPFAERRVLAMGGHEDGILACGRTLEEAGVSLVRCLAKALGHAKGQSLCN